MGAAAYLAHSAHDAGTRNIHYAAAHNDGLGGVVGTFGNLSLAHPNSMHQAAPHVAMPGGAYIADASFYPALGNHMQPAFNMPMPHVADSYGASGHFMAQGNVSGNYGGGYVLPYTPGRAASYGDSIERAVARDLPSLDNRRGSYSTTTNTESTPSTPFFSGLLERQNAPRVISTDRSNYSTPSPQQLAVSGMIGPVTNTKIKRIAEDELRALIAQEPVIPEAVPAVFTTPEQRKNIEQSLENRIEGNRNVYIRGLHPTTDDTLLLQYAARFGEVEQSKAIIDTSTGACKGFGFSKFKDVRDSEKCIQGFYLLGYEVGFARESFNARLKSEGDDGSTNLYISNLPKNITEAQLTAIFAPYVILSSKILRDSMGNSRGVGFARFESRDICEEVIAHYSGQAVGEEGNCIQVRYADTPAQKELKRVTAERRQYRTNEYNIGAYGTMAVGIHPTIYNTTPQATNWARSPRYTSTDGRAVSMYQAPLGANGGKNTRGSIEKE
ncbi:hypothetical protein BD289DRAFT_458175 [Coniella lustricola]|uniref:RRM domain-containing protein n=1 Tax=Coniella lustricola TaxID=2025994 RepID=A0A2T3AKW7_9PEZI|nr:hypothetical protein BD289DRAFT_458175 [Coniella lustricola]